MAWLYTVLNTTKAAGLEFDGFGTQLHALFDELHCSTESAKIQHFDGLGAGSYG